MSPRLKHRNERRGEADPARLPTDADFAAMRAAYRAVAPDPDHFDAFAAENSEMVFGFAGWTDDQLRRVDVPVLLLIGDTDFILVPDAAEIDLLPHGQLGVLPATTHMGMTRSHLVAPIVDAFLADA